MVKLFILLMSFSFLNPKETKVASKQNELVDVSISIYSVSYHQGGMQIPDEMKKEKPLGNFKLLLVHYYGPDVLPQVMDTIKTNSEGVFRTRLSEGKYGIVLLTEGDDLQIGQFLPKEYHQENRDWNNSSTWWITDSSPIVIKKGSTNQVKVVHYQTSICNKCP